MTHVAQTSYDGSLKVITTSDVDVCAMWNKEIKNVFKLPSLKIKGNKRLTCCLPVTNYIYMKKRQKEEGGGKEENLEKLQRNLRNCSTLKRNRVEITMLVL